MENIHDFYSIKEFANKLRVHQNTVRNAIRYGRLKAFKVGKGLTSSYRIPHSEIEMMAAHDFEGRIKNNENNENK